MNKKGLCLYIRLRNQQEYNFISVGDVKEGLQEKMHNVCDVDEVIFFQCARMVLDGILLKKEFDSFWYYCFSYAYCRLREINVVSYMEYYETCKSILRLFRDNWLGCDDEEKQCRYESALEFLEGWKVEIEEMDVPDPSLLFKDVPQRRITNAQGWEKFLRSQNSGTDNMEGWEKFLRSQNSGTDNMEGWEKFLRSQNSESGNIKGLEKLPGQEKSDTDKCEKLTINQHLAKVFCEFDAIMKENPQIFAEVRRYVEEQGGEASFEALDRFLDKDNETPSNGEKIKSKKQTMKRTEKANFRDLIQYPDEEKLLNRLHELIDGKRSADIGSVLLYAFQIQYYLARKPTRAEFESEFKYTGTWSGIHKYMMADNDAMMERANRIIIFPDEELRQSKKKK